MIFIFKKKLLLFFTGILVFQNIFSQPVITSVSPSSGPVGSVVTITGKGFSSTPLNNIVYFGAVKAPVNTATATAINVTVPAGASFEPVTVTANNQVAYSKQPFVVTFPGAAPAFAQDLFNTRKDVDIVYQGSDTAAAVEFCNVDLDGDGKPEMVSANFSASSISVVQNTSAGGKLSFDVHKDIATEQHPYGIDHGDFDGDGKQDIIVVNAGSASVSIFKNISTPGVIKLAPKIDIGLGDDGFINVAINDVDGDGKTDFVICGNNSLNISVYVNNSSLGNISFAPKVDIKMCYGYQRVFIRDLDDDGKPDLIANLDGYYKIVTLRNISTPGNILFESPMEFDTGNGPYDLAIGDLDGDGKQDVAVADNQAYTFSVLRNTSTAGSISFAEYVTFFVGIFPQRIGIGDIDGDGKPDVAVSNNNNDGYTVSIYKNKSSVDLIDFASRIDLITKGGPQGVSVEDMDGDGKPEIEVFSADQNVISVFTRCASVEINEQPVDTASCMNGNVSFKIGTTEAVNYQWQVNNGNEWSDLNDDNIYSGVTANELHVSGITEQMNGYEFRCSIFDKCGSSLSSQAKLIVNVSAPPTLKITTSDTIVCKKAIIKFTATSTNEGTSPIYQWKKNNNNVGLNSNTYIDSSVVNGDVVICTLVSSSMCASTNVAKSNAIVMRVTDQITPGVSVTASSKNVCFKTPVSFYATASDAGATPSYQWTKNDIHVGTDTSIYIDSLLNNGDIIKCILVSGLNCGIATTISNEIVMSINPLITPTISIAASKNDICPGTIVNFSALTSNEGLNPVFQWKKNGIDAGSNSANYEDSTIIEGDIITCILTASSTGGCLASSNAASNAITMNLLKNLPGKVNLGEDKIICAGASTTLTAPAGYASYLWQNNSTSPVLTATVAGSYSIKVVDACGNVSSDTVVISQTDGPFAFLPADTSVCSYEPIEIKPGKIYSQYLWNNNATTSSINVSTPGIYWLQVVDNNNCTGRDSINVIPKNCSVSVYVPSAFTPNGDGKNDLFKPFLLGQVKQYDFKIFNRFGEAVFHSKEADKGWDGATKGNPQTSNIFIWVCVYQLEGKDVIKKTGTVVLLK